jgi:fatty-acyl-CoA synthase
MSNGHIAQMGKGVLFGNADKKHEKAPDWKGTLLLSEDYKAGQTLKIAGWTKNTPKGQLNTPKAPQLRTIICLSEDERPGMWRWDDFLQEAEKTTPEALASRQSSLAADEPINIQYTSGTTGFPKGATLSHHNILNNGYFVAELMNFTEKDRLIIPVPLYHCFGMVMGNLGCVTHGAAMIYPSEGFDPASTFAAV